MSEPEFRIRIPTELEGGTYANALHVWHTVDEFTLDFCAGLPPQPEQDADYRLVARLRVPVIEIFEFLRILSDAMTSYERRFGEIRRPEER